MCVSQRGRLLGYGINFASGRLSALASRSILSKDTFRSPRSMLLT